MQPSDQRKARAVGATGSVVGIDLSEGMVQATNVEIAERKVGKVSALVMDAEQLAFPDATFDAVTCGFALFFMSEGACTGGVSPRLASRGQAGGQHLGSG